MKKYSILPRFLEQESHYQSQSRVVHRTPLFRGGLNPLSVVEGDQKTPFSIATTLRCRGGRNSFPGTAPLYP